MIEKLPIAFLAGLLSVEHADVVCRQLEAVNAAARASTTTSLASSSKPSVAGQSVTFTATVTTSAPGAGIATGTVTFKDGAATLGTGTLTMTGGTLTYLGVTTNASGGFTFSYTYPATVPAGTSTFSASDGTNSLRKPLPLWITP